MNGNTQQEMPQQASATRMGQLKNLAIRMASFVGRNKKPFGIAAAVFVVIVVWLLHRDGFKPEESSGAITISSSSGEVLMSIPEQAAITEEHANENP